MLLRQNQQPFPEKLSESEEKMKMEDKNGKNHSVKRTYHVKLVEKRITQQKDVGKALELIYVPKRLDQMIKPMMPQVMKEHSKWPIILKRPLQTNQPRRRLIQKTN